MSKETEGIKETIQAGGGIRSTLPEGVDRSEIKRLSEGGIRSTLPEGVDRSEIKRLSEGGIRSTLPKRGRPPKLEMPPLIDADADHVAEVVLQAKPKETWRFEEEHKQKHGSLPK